MIEKCGLAKGSGRCEADFGDHPAFQPQIHFMTEYIVVCQQANLPGSIFHLVSTMLVEYKNGSQHQKMIFHITYNFLKYVEP